MKKITLLFSLLITSIGFSQTELLTNGDFSNGDTNWALTGGSVVSGEAAFATTASAGNPWDTQLVQASLAFSNAQEYTVSFDARADAARSITVAIQNVGIWTDQFRQDFSLTTTMATYTATFNATSTNTNAQLGLLMGGFGVSDGVYFDNISLTTDVAPNCNDGIQNGDETGVDCGGSSCAECVSVSLPLDFSDASQLFTHDGAGDGGSVVLENGKLRFNGNGQAYDQAYLDLTETFSLFDPSNNTFTVTMEPLLVPDGEVRTHLIKASIGAGAAVELTGTSIGSAEQDVIFNFGTMGAEAWDRITIFMDFGLAPGGGTYNGKVTDYLISNISLGADPVIPDVEPTVAAPTPTHNAADVISLFSDAYTDVASNRNPGWGEVVAAETHASNEVLKTTNFIPFTFATPIDITNHTLHVDVWLPQLPSSGAGLLIKILDAANGPHEGNFIYQKENITAGQWNSIDIEITNFNQIQGTWDTTAQGRVDQVLLDIVDDTTMYVDNIYFWKPPTAGLDDNILNSVKMYPNPAKGIVNFSSASKVAFDVAVYDMLGKQVLRANAVQSQLNISSLNPGMYFVKMTQGSNVSTKKLLVN